MNIDINAVKDVYTNMMDDELLLFASNEGLKLSSEAFLVLREELKRRDIGGDIVNKLEHEIIFQASIQKKQFGEDLNRNLYLRSLDFAFSQKEKGVSNYDIYVGLIEQGISEEHSTYIVNRIDVWTEDLLKDSRLEIQSGVGTMLLGIIAIYATIQIGHFQLPAIILLLVGVVRIFIFSTKKVKYNRILNRIRTESSDSK
jgi:hypothetical protein